jgi:hypothetical protein
MGQKWAHGREARKFRSLHLRIRQCRARISKGSRGLVLRIERKRAGKRHARLPARLALEKNEPATVRFASLECAALLRARTSLHRTCQITTKFPICVQRKQRNTPLCERFRKAAFRLDLLSPSAPRRNMMKYHEMSVHFSVIDRKGCFGFENMNSAVHPGCNGSGSSCTSRRSLLAFAHCQRGIHLYTGFL